MAATFLRRRVSTPSALLARLSTTTAADAAVTTTPSSSSIKSKLRSASNPDTIAAIFQSAAHLPFFHADREIYKLAVQRLARARRPDLVECVLENQLLSTSAPKTEGYLVRIISLYSSAGLPDLAAAVFDRMPALGCPNRTERSLSALLTAYLDNRQHDRLADAFRTVPAASGVAPTVISHNILLGSLCLTDIAAARQLLDEMPRRGITPDIISFATVLNGYLKQGDDAGFDEILNEIHKKKLKPSLVIYNCRIMALCGKGRSSEAEELLDVMLSKDVLPSRLSLNTLIDGFCKEGDVTSAMRVLKRILAVKGKDGNGGVSPNFETYSGLLKALVEKGEFSSAVEICKKCLARKWAPPFKIMKELIDGLVKESHVDEAKEVAAKMKGALAGDAVTAWKKKLEVILPV